MRLDRDSELVSDALRGNTVLIVGGDPRQLHVARLNQAFGSTDFLHHATSKHDPSSRSFARLVDLPKVVLVVVLRCLTRSQHARDLHRLCRERGIPLLNVSRMPHPEALLPALTHARLDFAVIRRARSLDLGGAA